MSSDDHYLGDFIGPCALDCPESCEVPAGARLQLFDDVVAFSMRCPNADCGKFVRPYPQTADV